MPKKRTALYDWTSAKLVDGDLHIAKYQFVHNPQGQDGSEGKTGHLTMDVDPLVYPLDYLDELLDCTPEDHPRFDEYTDLVNAAKSAKAPPKKKAPAKKKASTKKKASK